MDNPELRLLILDVDGTLLTSSKKMTAAVNGAIRKANAAGLDVTLATGRMYAAIRQWVQEFGLRTPQICNNGAEVIEPSTEQRVLHLALSPETVAALIDSGRKQGMTVVLFAGDRVLGTAHTLDDWLIERNGEMVEVVSDAVFRDPDLCVEKLLFLCRAEPGRIESVREVLLEQWKPPMAPPFTAQVSEAGILNFCHPDAEKLRAARFLCPRLGVSMDQVAAVGDGENDASLIAAAGFGIAMGNAAPATRRVADMVVPDNDHDGAVQAIHQVIRRSGGQATG